MLKKKKSFCSIASGFSQVFTFSILFCLNFDSCL
jgi:hypothetical protein